MPSLPRGFTRKKTGNLKAVLLLHGMSSSPWEMTSLAGSLFRAGWDVACPLLADFHEWEGRFGEFSWEYWFNAARRALGPLEPGKSRYRRVAIVGTSLGGVLAGLLCIRNPWISSAVMVNPPFRFRGILVRLALCFRGLIRRIPVRIAPHLEKYYFPYFPVRAVAELGKLARQVLEEASAFRQPLLVFHSRNDRAVDGAGIADFMRKISSAGKELRVLRSAPHSLLAPYHKNNDAIFEGIIRFIGKP